mmetsp:Transcript_3750/g.16641  ORF Transcript_3750/g.16641 Transcript_3750/m.16641 type:complete len:289 (+) Transcript_3750:1-867(+)
MKTRRRRSREFHRAMRPRLALILWFQYIQRRSSSSSVVALPLEPVLLDELPVPEPLQVARPHPLALGQVLVEGAVLIVLVHAAVEVIEVLVPVLVEFKGAREGSRALGIVGEAPVLGRLAHQRPAPDAREDDLRPLVRDRLADEADEVLVLALEPRESHLGEDTAGDVGHVDGARYGPLLVVRVESHVEEHRALAHHGDSLGGVHRRHALLVVEPLPHLRPLGHALADSRHDAVGARRAVRERHRGHLGSCELPPATEERARHEAARARDARRAGGRGSRRAQARRAG